MTKNVMIRSFMAVVLLMMTTVAWADGATFKINEGVVDAATKVQRLIRLFFDLFDEAVVFEFSIHSITFCRVAEG